MKGEFIQRQADIEGFSSFPNTALKSMDAFVSPGRTAKQNFPDLATAVFNHENKQPTAQYAAWKDTMGYGSKLFMPREIIHDATGEPTEEGIEKS